MNPLSRFTLQQPDLNIFQIERSLPLDANVFSDLQETEKTNLAFHFFNVIPKNNWPSWVFQALSQLFNLEWSAFNLNTLFLNCCAVGTDDQILTLIDSIKTLYIVNDQEENPLHLALKNSKVTPLSLIAISKKFPYALSQKDSLDCYPFENILSLPFEKMYACLFKKNCSDEYLDQECLQTLVNALFFIGQKPKISFLLDSLKNKFIIKTLKDFDFLKDSCSLSLKLNLQASVLSLIKFFAFQTNVSYLYLVAYLNVKLLPNALETLNYISQQNISNNLDSTVYEDLFDDFSPNSDIDRSSFVLINLLTIIKYVPQQLVTFLHHTINDTQYFYDLFNIIYVKPQLEYFVVSKFKDHLNNCNSSERIDFLKRIIRFNLSIYSTRVSIDFFKKIIVCIKNTFEFYSISSTPATIKMYILDTENYKKILRDISSVNVSHEIETSLHTLVLKSWVGLNPPSKNCSVDDFISILKTFDQSNFTFISLHEKINTLDYLLNTSLDSKIYEYIFETYKFSPSYLELFLKRRTEEHHLRAQIAFFKSKYDYRYPSFLLKEMIDLQKISHLNFDDLIVYCTELVVHLLNHSNLKCGDYNSILIAEGEQYLTLKMIFFEQIFKNDLNLLYYMCLNTTSYQLKINENYIKIVLSSHKKKDYFLNALNSHLKFILQNNNELFAIINENDEKIIELQNALLRLKHFGFDLSDIIKPEHLVNLFRRSSRMGEFLFNESQKALSFSSITPFTSRSLAGKIFSEIFHTTVDRLKQDGGFIHSEKLITSALGGLSYKICAYPITKSFKIYLIKDNSAKEIFFGYILYEKIFDIIAHHAQQTHKETICTKIDTDFENHILRYLEKIDIYKFIIDNTLFYIEKLENTINIHFIKPGIMKFETTSMNYADIDDNLNAIHSLIIQKKDEIDQLLTGLKKTTSIFEIEQIHHYPDETIPMLIINKKIGQVYYTDRFNTKKPYQPLTEALLAYKIASDLNNFKAELNLWLQGKRIEVGSEFININSGFAIQETLSLPQEYHQVKNFLLKENLDSRAETWVYMPRQEKGVWFFVKDNISNQLLCQVLKTRNYFKLVEQRDCLSSLQKIPNLLNGYTVSPSSLNSMVRFNVKELPKAPAPLIYMQKLSDHFKIIKTQDWFKINIDKLSFKIDALEFNLNHYISYFTKSTPIFGWNLEKDSNDQSKYPEHQSQYEEFLIKATHLVQAMFLNNDILNLSAFTLEVAKFGQFCNAKQMEIVTHFYNIVFQQELKETLKEDVQEILSQIYAKTFYAVLNDLIHFIGNTEDTLQSIHVISYLKKTLSHVVEDKDDLLKIGYTIPIDPQTGLRDNGSSDLFISEHGLADYPAYILLEIFPALILPLFIKEFIVAQEMMLKKENWEYVGDLKNILIDRIEAMFKNKDYLEISSLKKNAYISLCSDMKKDIKKANDDVLEAQESLKKFLEQTALNETFEDLIELKKMEKKSHDQLNEMALNILSLTRDQKSIHIDLKEAQLKLLSLDVIDLSKKRSMSLDPGALQIQIAKLEKKWQAVQREKDYIEKTMDSIREQSSFVATQIESAVQSLEHIQKKEALIKSLALKQKNLSRVEERQPSKAFFEDYAFENGFLIESSDGSYSYLSETGLIQVLIQKKILIPSSSLYMQLLLFSSP